MNNVLGEVIPCVLGQVLWDSELESCVYFGACSQQQQAKVNWEATAAESLANPGRGPGAGITFVWPPHALYHPVERHNPEQDNALPLRASHREGTGVRHQPLTLPAPGAMGAPSASSILCYLI